MKVFKKNMAKYVKIQAVDLIYKEVFVLRSPVINCYRAILAQVNQLDSIYQPKIYLKELYMDLTELAYYLLEENQHNAFKGVEQMFETIREVNHHASMNQTSTEEVDYIVGEIKTHLEFLAMQLTETSCIRTQVQ